MSVQHRISSFSGAAYPSRCQQRDSFFEAEKSRCGLWNSGSALRLRAPWARSPARIDALCFTWLLSICHKTAACASTSYLAPVPFRCWILSQRSVAPHDVRHKSGPCFFAQSFSLQQQQPAPSRFVTWPSYAKCASWPNCSAERMHRQLNTSDKNKSIQKPKWKFGGKAGEIKLKHREILSAFPKCELSKKKKM